MLIPAITSANRRRLLQGSHSSELRRRRRPEFADTPHHLRTELETGRGEESGRLLYQRLGPEIRDPQTYGVAGNCAEATKCKHGQARSKKRRVRVNSGEIGRQGEVYSNGRGTDIERIKPTKGLSTTMANVLLCF